MQPRRYQQRTQQWQRFGTSIFSQMTALANQVGAVNLAQGFPDFDGPDEIKRRAIESIEHGPNQYAAAIGLKPLRELVARRRQASSGVHYDADTEVTITTGATEGIYSTMQALLQPGDEVICFTPVYDMYEPAAHARGASVRFVQLMPPRYEFPRADVEKEISPRTQVIVLNSPQNPSGKIFSDSELQIIADVAQQHDLIVVADEVYEEITFDGYRHRSIADLPGMKERTVVVSSTAKTFSFTGWKVGYVLAQPQLTEAIRNVHQYTVFCTATPLQQAMTAAFELPQSYYEDLRENMRHSRDRLLAALQECGWEVCIPQGTYFITANYGKHSARKDQDLVRELARKFGIATIPMSTFYPGYSAAPSTWLRFAFCKTPKTIDQAISRLHSITWPDLA
jgi:N-succinyldiaminopimelate aminotransferase